MKCAKIKGLTGLPDDWYKIDDIGTTNSMKTSSVTCSIAYAFTRHDLNLKMARTSILFCRSPEAFDNVCTMALLRASHRRQLSTACRCAVFRPPFFDRSNVRVCEGGRACLSTIGQSHVRREGQKIVELKCGSLWPLLKGVHYTKEALIMSGNETRGSIVPSIPYGLIM